MVASNPYASRSSDQLQHDTGEVEQPTLFAYSGRVNRMRFFTYLSLVNLVGMFVSLVVMGILSVISPALGVAAYFLIVLALMVYSFSPYIRRLHDFGMSGWWTLMMFVPLANIVFILMMLFRRGDSGANAYGLPNPPNEGGIVAGFWTAIALTVIIPFIFGILAAIAIPQYHAYVERAEQSQMQQR